jgi:hypothetical protein
MNLKRSSGFSIVVKTNKQTNKNNKNLQMPIEQSQMKSEFKYIYKKHENIKPKIRINLNKKTTYQ